MSCRKKLTAQVRTLSRRAMQFVERMKAMVLNPHQPVKQYPCSHRPRKFNRFENPSLQEIPGLWNELLAEESLAPEAVKGAIARARTMLLDKVPNWKLPEVLDALATGRALS